MLSLSLLSLLLLLLLQLFLSLLGLLFWVVVRNGVAVVRVDVVVVLCGPCRCGRWGVAIAIALVDNGGSGRNVGGGGGEEEVVMVIVSAS